MNFLEDLIITDITHVRVANFKKYEKSNMQTRPWHGIAFSLGGELVYIHNSKKIPLSGNQVVFLPAGTTYEVDCTKAGSFAVINFLTAKKLNISDFICIEAKTIDGFQREFAVMHKSFRSDSTQNKYENLSSFYKIFSMLISTYDKKRIPSALNRALEYIENNINCSELSNTQIAENVGISEVYLRKLFSNHMAMSVNQYIQNKRIENAKILLTKTSLSVTEISAKCGYSCIYYFCKSFKHKTGYTPTQYKNENTHNLF